jgi:hypothetical protein
MDSAIHSYVVSENIKGGEPSRVRMNRADFEEFLRSRGVSEREIAKGVRKRRVFRVGRDWTIGVRTDPIKRYAYDFTEEYCPFCESEVTIAAGRVSACPVCGHGLFPCSAYDCSEACDWSSLTKSCFMFQRSEEDRFLDEEAERSCTRSEAEGEALPPRALNPDIPRLNNYPSR